MFTIVHEHSGLSHAFRSVLFVDRRVRAGLNHEILERVTGRAPSPEAWLSAREPAGGAF